jgi:membrane-associated phospholipid phosphatase
LNCLKANTLQFLLVATFLFLRELLFVLALTMSITISLKAQSDGLFSCPRHMCSGYAQYGIPRDSYLELNENTLKMGSTLNEKYYILHHLEASYLHTYPLAFRTNILNKDISRKSVAFRRAFIAPVLFAAAGLSFFDEDNDDNYEVQAERNRYIPNFRNHADDYVQHIPIVVVYGLNWLGVKGKNDFANRTALLIKSEVMVGILTFSLKRITAVPRPDTKELTSFPSGHTAQAFAAATFMAKEYGHVSIWYSIGAYTVATGVGAMRVMNNRHWVSDVLVGAGIGILSTNLVYLTHQYHWGRVNRRGQTSVVPSYDGQTAMVNIIHRIN